MAIEKFWWSNFGNRMKIEPTVNILKIHPGVLCLGYSFRSFAWGCFGVPWGAYMTPDYAFYYFFIIFRSLGDYFCNKNLGAFLTP